MMMPSLMANGDLEKRTGGEKWLQLIVLLPITTEGVEERKKLNARRSLINDQIIIRYAYLSWRRGYQSSAAHKIL